jgi:hypothetical protein
MNRIEKRNDNNRISPSGYTFIRNFENNLPQEPERKRISLRPSSGEFIVEWQMNSPPEDERKIS